MAFDAVTYALCKSFTKKSIAALGKVFNYKGEVPTYDDLPTEGNKPGDVYTVVDTGMEYVWADASATHEAHWESFGAASEDSRYIGLISGDGTHTQFLVEHNLGTRDFSITLYNAATFEDIVCDITRTTVNSVTVEFSEAPAVGENYVVVCLLSKGPRGEQGIPGRVQDVTKNGVSVVNPQTGIAELPDGGTWGTITEKPFETIGDGLMVDNNALTYTPATSTGINTRTGDGVITPQNLDYAVGAFLRNGSAVMTDAEKAHAQGILGSQEFIFTMADNTTVTKSFVCTDVQQN